MKTNDLSKTVDKLTCVIRIQSSVINDLLQLLLQHLSAEELDSLPAIAKINEAAKLKSEIL